MKLKTSLRCEEVYFLQWEHINGGFCRLVLVLPFQLSVSSAQNVTVPNMFLIFINFQLENWYQFWQKMFCAIVLRSHSRLRESLSFFEQTLKTYDFWTVDLIRINYLNWKRWIEQVDFSQQNSWFFWPFYFSLGFLITIKQYDCCYSRNTVVAYEKLIFGAKSAVNEPMNSQLLWKFSQWGPQEMRNLWNNVTSPVYCIIKMI